jgi:Rod binding domain-containing protein
MPVEPLTAHVSAANVPLEQLAGNAALTEQEKIGEASRQFESLLLHQILAETQKTVIPSKYADDSTSAGIYRDMVANQLADCISRSGTFGLGKTLEHQLTLHTKPHSEAGAMTGATTTGASAQAHQSPPSAPRPQPHPKKSS